MFDPKKKSIFGGFSLLLGFRCTNTHVPIPGFVGVGSAAVDDDNDPPASLQAIETVLSSLIKIGSNFFSFKMLPN